MGSWCCEGSGSVRDSSLTRATAGSGSEHTAVPVQMVMARSSWSANDRIGVPG